MAERETDRGRREDHPCDKWGIGGPPTPSRQQHKEARQETRARGQVTYQPKRGLGNKGTGQTTDWARTTPRQSHKGSAQAAPLSRTRKLPIRGQKIPVIINK